MKNIPEPSAAELFAAKALVWAFTHSEDSHHLDPSTAAVAEYLATVDGYERFNLLKNRPEYLWGYNIIGQGGVDLLSQAITTFTASAPNDVSGLDGSGND